MIRVILERPEQPPSLMVFAQPVVVLGRGDTDGAEPVDWQLPYPDVSRRQCRFSCAGGQRFIEGLSDRSPTYVNGRRVQGMTAVAAGDEIRFGYCVIRVCEEVAVVPPKTTETAPSAHPRAAVAPPDTPPLPRPAPPPKVPPTEVRPARVAPAAPVQAAPAERAPATEGDVSILVERARHWDLRGQPAALLLTGSLLQRGRTWLRVGPDLGEVGGLMRLYVERSVQARRSRLQRLGLAAGVTLTTALTGSAVAQAWLPELRIPEAVVIEEVSRPRCKEDVKIRADALTAAGLKQGDDTVALLLTSRALQGATAGGCRNVTSAEPTLRELLAKRHSRLLDRREGPIQDAVVRRDGRYIAAADASGRVTIWDVQGRRAAAPLDDGGVPARKLAWSRDNRWLATGTAAGEVVVWDVQEPSQAVMQRRISDHRRPIEALAFSPEGGLLASADAGELRLWDMGGEALGESRGKFTGLTGSISHLQFSAGASRLFGLSEDGKVKIWSIAPAGPAERLGKPTTLPADGHMVAMAVNLDGTQIVTGDRSGVVLVWRLRGGTWRSSAGTTHEGEVVAIQLVPGHDRFLSLAKDRTLTLVDLAARGKQIQPTAYALGPLQNPARHLVVESSGRRALTIDDTGVAELWLLESRQKQPIRFAEQPRQVTVVTEPSAQSVVLTGEVDGSLRVWDLMLEGGSAGSHLLSEHRGGTPELALSHEGGTLVSTTRGKNIQVWTLDGAMVPTLDDIRTASRPVEVIAVSANGRWVAGASGNLILVWDLEKRDRNAAPANLVEHADTVMHLRFSVDGEWLVSADLRGSVRTWALGAAGPESKSRHAVEHPPSIHALAVSREHVAVGTGASDDTRGEVFAWRLGESGKGDDKAVWDHAKAAHRLIFDATGNYLASGSGDGGVKVGKLGEEGFTVGTQYSHGQSVSALAFAALPGQGVTLASGARDGEVLVSTPTDRHGGSPRKLAKREGEIVGLAFGADPGLLFIAGEDGAALLQQMEGTETRTIPLVGHRGAIVALHADVGGRVVVTMGDDQTLRAWPLEVPALQHIACSFVGRNLRAEEWPVDFRPTAEPQCPAR